MLPLLALLALTPHVHEGDVQAFPALNDAQGAPLADGRYIQFVTTEERASPATGGAPPARSMVDVLHIEARYDFPGGRVIDEKATLRLRPQLSQESWEWVERSGDKVLRKYSADFVQRKAHGLKGDDTWDEDLDIEPGKTFAGIAFISAVKALRPELKAGEHIELHAVAMTPKPRVATVTVTHDGPERVQMSGRTLPGDRFTIHAEIPAIAKLFIDVPDNHIWLVAGEPAAFLRFEGSLLEPKDPIVRIDLVPGPPANK